MSDSSLNERVAEEVRVTLARRRLSASELARRMGVTQPYISRRLTGDITISIDDLEKMADALEVEITALLPKKVDRLTYATLPGRLAPRSGKLLLGASHGDAGQPGGRGQPVMSASDRGALRRPAIRSYRHEGMTG